MDVRIWLWFLALCCCCLPELSCANKLAIVMLDGFRLGRCPESIRVLSSIRMEEKKKLF